jgi:hypothetical protein
MNRTRKNVNNKLKEFGQRLGMNENDSLKSKKTLKNAMCICLVISALVFIGFFIASRIDPSGQYYIPPGIRDFSFLTRIF